MDAHDSLLSPALGPSLGESNHVESTTNSVPAEQDVIDGEIPFSMEYELVRRFN